MVGVAACAAATLALASLPEAAPWGGAVGGAVRGAVGGVGEGADGDNEWPTARGGAGRQGAADAPVLSLTAGQFGLAWRRSLDAPVSAAPIIADGRVIVADTRGVLHAIDLLTGWPLWSRPLGVPVLAAVTRAGDAVLVPCTDGHLIACALRDGAERWRVQLPAALEAAAAVHGDTAYVVTRDGHLHGLDVSATGGGAVRWSRPLGAPAFAPPALGDGVVAVLPVNGHLQCFSAADGTPRWEATLGPVPCYTAPAIDRGEVVAVSGGGVCAAFAVADGAVRYRVELGTRISASPAVRHDRIAIVAENGDCRVLDREDGSPLWHRPSPFSAGPYRAGIVAGPDWMFVASTRGRLHIKRLDAAFGSRTDLRPMTNDGRAGSLRTGPALHRHGFVGVRDDGLVFAYREAAGDPRILRAALGLGATASPEQLDGWIDELTAPASSSSSSSSAAAALELCRHGHAAHDALSRRMNDVVPATRAAVQRVQAHLQPFLRLSGVIRSHLAASRLARRKLWVACLADADVAVVRAAVRRWPADADAALLKGFDPAAAPAVRRAFVRRLPR